MSAGTNLYLVTAQDTVIQCRDYVVRAESVEMAKERVREGMFITESTPETVEVIDSEIFAAEMLTGFKEGCEI